MTRLIVEEGGKRRAFRMGAGVLTVGSGAEARLKLGSTGVAEIHLELEAGEGGVRMRPRPGVIPPKVAGQAVEGEFMLAPGKTVEFGGARLWVEPEEGQAEASAPAGAPADAPAAPRVQAPTRTPASRGPAKRGSRVQRRQEGPRKKGLPGWAVFLIIIGVTGVVFMLWYRGVQHAAGGEGLAMNKLRAARQAAENGHFEDALRELAEIPLTSLTPEQALDKDRLEKEFAERKAEAELSVENMTGTKYLDTMLKKYEGLYLQGEPEKAKARLFLKRCKTFHERWPQHPEMDWVQRQEARFAGYVDMNAPPNWEDVSWEVKYLTGGNPRNYVAAFALIDELLTRVSGEDATKAQNLRDELVAGRPEYATDRLYQARYEFEKKEDPAKAVWWLMNNVAYLGDEALANESARFLVKMPDLEGHLRAYKQSYPEIFDLAMKNPVVDGWAEDARFIP